MKNIAAMKFSSLIFLIATMVLDIAAADNILVAHSLGMGSHISIPQALSRQARLSVQIWQHPIYVHT